MSAWRSAESSQPSIATMSGWPPAAASTAASESGRVAPPIDLSTSLAPLPGGKASRNASITAVGFLRRSVLLWS